MFSLIFVCESFHLNLDNKKLSSILFQGCVAILSVTWIVCLTFYGVLVLPKGEHKHYHFFSGCFLWKWENYLKLQAIMKQQDLHLISFLCFLHLNRIVFNVINLYSSLFFSFFSTSSGYYYNSTGLLACEPFFSKPSYRILASCAFYFPTTMVLMYCYGSSFHANRFRLASTASSSFTTPAAITEKVHRKLIYLVCGCAR